jgi:CheY-like chemotaxis protein
LYGLKFTAAGFAVQSCLSGRDALQTLRDGLKPAAILFDITMPEMDGFGFLQKLGEEHLGEGTLKIALTNQNDESEKQKASELGASRYIVKASMIPSEVVNTVVEELGKHGAKP